jgi:uncharacterized membrane protein YedE/YeeE
MRDGIVALVSGVTFGAGLALAGMTNPAKVLGFLDVAGAWDPSLAFVMAAALGVFAVAYRFTRDEVETPSGVDARLVVGATLFGVGWGLAGFCPGPAIAALSTGSSGVVIFVVAMIAGMGLYRVFEKA